MEENESIDEKPVKRVKDKKRIAICSNALGREGRIMIRGQIVDMGVADITQADGLWDLMTGLLQGQENDITPFLDFSLAPVRKPVLTIEVLNEKEKKVFESPDFVGDNDGFFSYELISKLKAGSYTYYVTFKGSDSYRQYTKDIAYLNIKEDSEIRKITTVGKGKLRVLSEKYNSYITTSDIDQTYLATQLGSKAGLLSALFETPSEKIPLPGMPELYKHIRKDTKDSPLSFISASPHYFRRSISMTIKNHGIEYESLYLKYLDGTVKGVVDKITHSIFNLNELLSEGVDVAFERAKKFFGSTYQSLFDQLSYKLSTLLGARIFQPNKAKEILLGDNTESDYLIFSLYQIILLGLIRGKDLEDYLYHLNFLGRDAVTRDYAKKICRLQEECISIHGTTNSVHSVFINMTNLGPMANEMETNVLKAMPKNLDIKSIKEFRMYLPTEGALGFATNLAGLGVIEFESLLEVTKDITGKWLNGKVLDEKYLVSLTRNLSVLGKAEKTRQELYEIVKTALG